MTYESNLNLGKLSISDCLKSLRVLEFALWQSVVSEKNHFFVDKHSFVLLKYFFVWKWLLVCGLAFFMINDEIRQKGKPFLLLST